MFEKLIFFVLHLKGSFRTLKTFKISGTKPRGSSAGNLARFGLSRPSKFLVQSHVDLRQEISRVFRTGLEVGEGGEG
jgi:hypothetical protein